MSRPKTPAQLAAAAKKAEEKKAALAAAAQNTAATPVAKTSVVTENGVPLNDGPETARVPAEDGVSETVIVDNKYYCYRGKNIISDIEDVTKQGRKFKRFMTEEKVQYLLSIDEFNRDVK